MVAIRASFLLLVAATFAVASAVVAKNVPPLMEQHMYWKAMAQYKGAHPNTPIEAMDWNTVSHLDRKALQLAHLRGGMKVDHLYSPTGKVTYLTSVVLPHDQLGREMGLGYEHGYLQEPGEPTHVLALWKHEHGTFDLVAMHKIHGRPADYRLKPLRDAIEGEVEPITRTLRGSRL